jgi:glycosyltransferase involved in cell wall biosynthesis
MKIAIVHNTYQQAGGEDVVVEQESRMLQSHGHTVVFYRRSNHEIAQFSKARQLLMVKDIVYSGESKREIRDLLRHEKPNIVHVHNTFIMISPSAYEACQELGIPVLQTLHNFRLLCPAWTLSRNGAVCEECLTDGLWRGVLHGCYRDSRPMTAAVALMLKAHRTLGTWTHSVDGYVALSDFARSKFIDGGLPGQKIYVKPNFVQPDPGMSTGAGGYALFVGRLSQEKGPATLISAWAKRKITLPLVIVGEGPLRPTLEAQVSAQGLTNITFRGWLPREQTMAMMKEAVFLVTPSEWYETFGMVITEAFACGVPVICSRMGAMKEIVADQSTGLHFTPGDAEDLATKVEWACSHQSRLDDMRRSARREYESRYTAEKNYGRLMEIYDQTMHSCMRN